MLDPAQAAVLGAIQGATEFLPVSSSAHLVIFPALVGWPQPSVAFDVLLHAGTLAAIVVRMQSEIVKLASGAFAEARAGRAGTSTRVIGLLALATVPAALAGVLFGDAFESLFARPVIAGAFLFATAGFMLVADRFGGNSTDAADLSAGGAGSIGLAQAAAIAPGISRSGATISAGMLLGLRREAAARFSFLLSIPIIAGSFLFKMGEFGGGGVALGAGLAGFGAAAVSGYVCAGFLLKYLTRHTLRPFAVYCALAGAFTIVFFLLKS